MPQKFVSAAFMSLVLMAPLPVLAQPPAATPAKAAPAQTSVDERALNLFSEVFERVRGQYVEKMTDEQLVKAAIEGMLTSLDPHSSFLDTEDFAEMQVQTRGEFGGLGIEVTLENGYVKVISPIDDTPAARAGFQSGDLITQIDGEPVQGLTLKQAVERMRGPVGQPIKVMVRRGAAEAAPFEVNLTREVIRSQPVKSRAEGDVGYIRITGFSRQTQPGLEKAVQSLQQQLGNRLIGYVVDLRNNPGGLLDQAVSVADSFLDKGNIVSTRGRDGVETQRFDATSGDLTKGLPIVVLVNGGSASASEIVAGALQDQHRAVLMGTQTFGKGSVQTIMPLPDQKAMKITTARYYTPSGRSIQALGVTPDITVEQAKLEQVAQTPGRKESDLRGALSNDTLSKDAPRGQPPAATPAPGAAPAPAAPAVPGSAEDYQLRRAVDLLVGTSLFRQLPAQPPAQPKVTKTAG
ncbi:S41 family peptidase [Skermanella mucosa]|uniref:S41 family peptidase n=1 Tax=Skermanella mucosa TaxID=1789672 RepID=UPI00192ACDEC|nr:S41 family peptidase [Skermanella mucosa]UEM21592.1 S41 family peptidase [Skermanella mucosa]